MNLTVFAEQQGSTAQMLITFLPLVLILAVFYFIIIKPQRKQEKEDAKMRDNLEIGDEVVTNGGIVGIVFQIKEDTVVIETGGDRSKIRVKKWAIAKNETVHDD
ncbi:MAG: preprotein translocase subunit YajC [Ruminococcus sp.]|nr:preprotein translocase subunit YajC [Ruminococcus sp.]MBR2303513.1 preprotein translocase subunit YajC [Ruminococcus sp.]